MGWPKGKKRTETEEEVQATPVVEIEKKKEPEVAPAIHNQGTCRTCGHGEKIHYEGRDRQCNTEGCRCSRMVK